MKIEPEYIVINGKSYKRFISPNNKIIRKIGTNEEYGEAIDLAEKDYEYEETEKEIENGDIGYDQDTNRG